MTDKEQFLGHFATHYAPPYYYQNSQGMPILNTPIIGGKKTMQIDKESDTWKAIEKFLNEQLTSSQSACMEQISYEATTYWRGYYRALKEVQHLATQKPMEEIAQPDYT